MKRLFVAALLFSLTAASSWSAPWDGRRGGPDRQRGGQHERGGDWRGAPPQQPDRRFERDDRRDGGALSEEERRGLHRDLDRANRELYRRR